MQGEIYCAPMQSLKRIELREIWYIKQECETTSKVRMHEVKASTDSPAEFLETGMNS